MYFYPLVTISLWKSEDKAWKARNMKLKQAWFEESGCTRYYSKAFVRTTHPRENAFKTECMTSARIPFLCEN